MKGTCSMAKYTLGPGIEFAEVRARAWKTRREKYGKFGHAGSYSRSPGGPCIHCAAALPMLIRLHVEGVLSEGQAAKATGLHRIRIRELADDLVNSTPPASTLTDEATAKTSITE